MKLMISRFYMKIRKRSGMSAVFAYRPTPYALALAIYVLCVVFFLSFRSLGLNPLVPDEWVYYQLSTMMAFRDVIVPSYLYFLVFGVTNYCGDGFLDCARVINAVLFASTIPFVYQTAKQYCPSGTAFLIAICAGISPASLYSAYFMPEAMYSCAFWVFAWYALRPSEASPRVSALISGVILAIAALIKAHALFLVPGFLLFLIYRSLRAIPTASLLETLVVCGCFMGSFLTTRLALGYAFADGNGTSLFGPAYTSFANSALSSANIVSLLSGSGKSLLAHVSGLCVLFALPLCALVVGRSGANGDSMRQQRSNEQLRVFVFAVMIPLLVIVAVFTTKVAGSNFYESADRIHMRYYNFAFPLLSMVAATQMQIPQGYDANLLKRIIISLLLVCGLAYFAPIYLSGFRTNIVDSPELFGLHGNHRLYYVFTALLALSVIAWSFSIRRGAMLFLFLFLPLTMIVSTFYVHREGRNRLTDDVYDYAGKFAAQYLGHSERTILIGPDDALLHRSLLSFNNANAQKMVVPSGATIPFAAIPQNINAVLLIGDVQVSGAQEFECSRLTAGALTLIRRICAQADFRGVSSRNDVKYLHGLANPESWGVWSNDEVVAIKFFQVLPRNFELQLRARAFGPNGGLPFKISAGTETRVVSSLRWDIQEVRLGFETDGTVDEITIAIPKPTSPKELRISEDTRRLGIGIQDLRVIPASIHQIK